MHTEMVISVVHVRFSKSDVIVMILQLIKFI